MQPEINDLKFVLYGILEALAVEADTAQNDVKAFQNMDVGVSNAAKKDGVSIVQIQQVNVNLKLIPQVINALKLVDIIAKPERSTLTYSPQIEIDDHNLSKSKKKRLSPYNQAIADADK